MSVALTKVHVMRHGEVHNPEGILYGRLPGYRLSDRGRAQAQRVADSLAGNDIAAVIASPLQRAQETATPVAAAHGLDVDCHIDETLDPASTTLLHLAEAVLRNRFQGRVVAGHCCAVSRQSPDQVRRTLDRVAEAGIAIVSLPMCNLYLQDRVAGTGPPVPPHGHITG